MLTQHRIHAQVRAGEGRAEEQGMVYTNTVFKTSVDSGLSRRGQSQVSHAPVSISSSTLCAREWAQE